MNDVAIYRAPRARPMGGRKIISPVARAEMERIERLLSGSEAGPVGDEALAERERLWAQHRKATDMQSDLLLGNPLRHDQH